MSPLSLLNWALRGLIFYVYMNFISQAFDIAWFFVVTYAPWVM